LLVARIADRFWEGIKLEHVYHKKIVFPYIIFTVFALLFEIFLLFLIGVSSYFFYQFAFYPNTLFYIGASVLLLQLIITILILKSLYRKIRFQHSELK